MSVHYVMSGIYETENIFFTSGMEVDDKDVMNNIYVSSTEYIAILRDNDMNSFIN